MNTSGSSTVNRSRARGWFLLSALFAGLFAINVALFIMFIKFGISLWRLGDVGEFLLVVAAMVFFVSGLLAIEEAPESFVAPTHDNY
jgi:hypothetical protein